MQVIGERLALPGSLGRICPRLCEEGCRRCDLDQGLAIGALHRYAADRDRASAAPYLPPRAPATGRRVAIVGAGPAGLAAAWYLLRKGHACTLFDAHPQPGGMLRYGIPAYRLPKDALDAEIQAIHTLGARFRMGARWGEEFTLAELRGVYGAVFVAIGAQRAQGLRCPGEENALAGVEFLKRGEPDASGRRRPVPVEGSDFAIAGSTVIAAIGQSVERALAEREGLRVTAWGIAVEAQTLATNLPGVFAGGDAVLGADLAVRAVAAGRIAAASIHQYLTGQAVTGEPAIAGIAMQPVDDAERAAISRAIESAARVRSPEIPMERRLASFDEVEHALPHADAAREARRCLSCGCRKADCCLVRSLATEYAVDVYRFAGQRRTRWPGSGPGSSPPCGSRSSGSGGLRARRRRAAARAPPHRNSPGAAPWGSRESARGQRSRWRGRWPPAPRRLPVAWRSR